MSGSNAFLILIPALYAVLSVALLIVAVVDRKLVSARWAALGFAIACASILVDGFRDPDGSRWVNYFTVITHFLALMVMVQAFLSRHARHVPLSIVAMVVLVAIYVMPSMPWAPPYASRGFIVQATGAIVIASGLQGLWQARRNSMVDMIAFAVVLAACLSYAGKAGVVLVNPIGPSLAEVSDFYRNLNIVFQSISAVMGMSVGIVLLMMIGHDMVRSRIEEGEIDALTQVGNRRQLERLLDEDARGRQPIGGVVVIDLDHFKRVNDNFGHDAGDTVLREVAARLKALYDGTGTVCRTGGEEFVALVPPENNAALAQLAIATRKAVAELAFERPLNQLKVTASIGFYLREQGVSARQAIQRADRAVYCAKTDGRDRVVGAVVEGGLQVLKAVA
ncbi:GGDEF domain-containing protein [Aurantiacibacter gilvus]|uniref:diguanylate cyclase n=1 Tax=Aurantiacibacter gilvus TaxID=3139141 RepID=A0ABU9IAN4_9SPHN